MRRIFLGLFIFLSFCSVVCYSQQEQPVKPKVKDKEEDKDEPAKVSPVLIRGPYLQTATSHSIMIRWRTDALSRSRVWFGKEMDSLKLIADDSALVTEHKVILQNLEPLTKYYYRIGAIKEILQGDSNNYFLTLPTAGSTTTVRIAAFGDCGNNSVNQRNVRDQLIKYLGGQYLNAWILLGDNTYPDGTDAEFQANFFNIYKDNLLKKYPLFPSPGNHDYHDKEFSAAVAQQTHDIAYYQNFSMPTNGEAGGVPSHSAAYYSFDIGNVHFLSLDSYGKEENARMYDTLGPQVQWVKKDLEKSVQAEWIIAYWHHPPFTMGSHNGDKENELVQIRQNFITILERYGVDLVICGHSHDYERSRMMQGYYGKESEFDSAKYTLTGSSGKDNGAPNSQPYSKKNIRGKGTIYVVSGSAGKLGGTQETFPHNAMYFSDAVHGGSSLIEVTGEKLKFRWICADGIIRDQFTIVKKTGKK
jgi:hypothetical protein